jgi:hypothetical protein
MEMVYPLANDAQRTYAMHLGSVIERLGTIEECKLIGAKYVQRVVDALNNVCPNLGIFNACKLFSPNLYLANDDERTCITEEWLERLFVKLQTFEEEQDWCRGKCLEMVETVREMIPNKLYLKLGSLQVPLHSGQSIGMVWVTCGGEL